MLTDWVAVVSALIAAAGLVFGALELRHLRQQRAEDDRLATKGVSVSWQPLSAPKKPERDGSATWVYEICVHNPGRFPISGIAVELTFPVPVARRHSDGSLDEAHPTIALEQPVIHGGTGRRWKRTLVMDQAEASRRLPESADGVDAVVQFVDVRGDRHVTRWPRRVDRRLIR